MDVQHIVTQQNIGGIYMIKFKKLAAVAAAAVMAVSAMALSASALNVSQNYTGNHTPFTGGLYINVRSEFGIKQCSADTYTQNIIVPSITAALDGYDTNGNRIPPQSTTNPNNMYASAGVSTPNLSLGINATTTHKIIDFDGTPWTYHINRAG